MKNKNKNNKIIKWKEKILKEIQKLYIRNWIQILNNMRELKI